MGNWGYRVSYYRLSFQVLFLAFGGFFYLAGVIIRKLVITLVHIQKAVQNIQSFGLFFQQRAF